MNIMHCDYSAMNFSFAFLILTAAVFYCEACEDSGPLGMITGQIQDWQISSSSAYPAQWDSRCGNRHGRLYQPNGFAWCAKYSSASEWLQVDLGVLANVTGVMVQGRGDKSEWVTSFKLSYAGSDRVFQYVTDHYGNQKKFDGPRDSHEVRHFYLDRTLSDVKYIKFHVISWNQHPSLRVEILGCQKCRQLIGLPPFGRFAASSTQNFHKGTSCTPADAHYYSSQAWCSKFTNGNQWLELDVGPPTLITGLVTKGRGDTKKRHWVTSYSISYANHSDQQPESFGLGRNSSWTFYKEGGNKPKLFEGNIDKYMERYHYLDKPFVARFVRIHPVTWHNHISMRAGLLGCPFRGQCSNEFFKVNDASPCVENLAYKKNAFMNVKRHSKRNAVFDDGNDSEWDKDEEVATKAVDGEVDRQLHKCTLIDNSRTDTPVWMVDLGRRHDISGVVVLTGIGVETTPQNFLTNVEKLTVYVQNKKSSLNRSPHTECNSITTENQALYHPRLHFQCDKSMTGRYVYVEPWGKPTRWTNFFNAVLCEVMVYS